MSATETEAPRRLVSADVIRMQHELAMAQATRSPEPSVSVEFTLNAKGETQHTVKVYAPAGIVADELDALAQETLQIARAVHDAAREAYPRV